MYFDVTCVSPQVSVELEVITHVSATAAVDLSKAELTSCYYYFVCPIIVIIGTSSVSNEPRHEKTCLRGLQPGMTQTGLLSW